MQMIISHDPMYLAFAAIVILYLSAVVALSNRLKRYPEAWEKTGGFLLLMNNTPRTGIRFLKFVFSDGYRTLDDRPVTLMVWIVRVLLGVGLILFAWNAISVSAR